MKIIAIVGPTAVGKTDLSIKIARRISGEIISADSRQIYTHLKIGTAKPTSEQKRQATFHLIDFVHPDNSYSCGQFARDAELKIEEIISKNRIPIICGGTGLYIKSLFNPLHTLPVSNREIKNKLQASMEKYGVEYLYKQLLSVDPQWAGQIMPRDKQRIMRGLEVYEMSGKPLSSVLKTKKRKTKYLPHYIGLNLPRAELYNTIDQRFDKMIKQGLVNEVELLLRKGLDPASNALRTIGYKEIIQYLKNEMILEEAIQRAKQRTRNFAKRQVTWFNKISGLQWYNPADPEVVKYIINQWKVYESAEKK
ncbi:MAG: tRNA (adenosine(37)-N6)-dimethylallyltransferase MiaA [bacterium]